MTPRFGDWSRTARENTNDPRGAPYFIKVMEMIMKHDMEKQKAYYPPVTFDSYDVVLAVALWGGYETGIWFPAIVLFTFHATVAWLTKD